MWNYFQIEINSIDYICCCALAHTKGYIIIVDNSRLIHNESSIMQSNFKYDP